jgi:hypothetical protein
LALFLGFEHPEQFFEFSVPSVLTNLRESWRWRFFI